ncbi:MAG: hydrolase [Nitrososphaerota archaeon]|nr:hydrolase [Nitrososphaerota archaeon]
MAEPLNIEKPKTALVVIDLQKGILQMETKPHPAKEVIANAARLAAAFRKSAMPVFLVHVAMDPGTALKTISDETFQRPPNAAPDWADFVPEMTPQPGDVVITKRQWGAFYGTDLELRLRRRGVDTIVLCGIATDYGVESTARFAYEFGFQQIFAEDAMSSRSEEQHNAAVNFVLKRIGRVRKTEEILKAL